MRWMIVARKKTLVVDPEKIKWEPSKESPGSLFKLLWVDKKTGAMAVLAKFSKGFREPKPKHKHPQDRHGIVLKGKWVYEIGRSKKEVKRGMYVFLPAGLEHRIIDTPEEGVAFIYFDRPPR